MGPLRVLAVLLAAVVLLVLALTVALVFVCPYRLLEYNTMFGAVRAPRAKISDLYPTLKTGDLVFFVATTHSPSNSVLTQTFFSHAGVVLREGELVYLSEARAALERAPGSRGPRPNGANITPLLARLKCYTGDYYALLLSRPLDWRREEALKATAERLRARGYPYPSVAQMLLGLVGRKTEARHCFQHVAHLLDGAGLAPRGRPAPLAAAGFLEVARAVCALPGLRLAGGYAYSPPVQILYDIGALRFEEPAPWPTEFALRPSAKTEEVGPGVSPEWNRST
jgi:hypothetical protein